MLLVAGSAATLDLIGSVEAEAGEGAVGLLRGPAATGRWLPGGAALTVALAAATAGARVRVWHPRPATPFDPAFRNLIRAGVNVTLAPTGDEPARCLIIRSPDRSWLWSSTPAAPAPENPGQLLQDIEQLVICPVWGAWAETLLEAAVARDIPVSAVGFVPNGPWRWSVVVASEDQVHPAAAEHIDAELLIITRGPAGASIRTEGRWVETPAVPATVVDPTGAGDVFGGTLIAKLVGGSPVREAAQVAAEAAARCCEEWGAQSFLQKRHATTSSETSRRVRGALAGLACGDAYGMPASFIEPAVAARLWPAGIQEMLAAPAESPYHAGYPAGKITDDTEQSLALTEAMVRSGGPIDPSRVAEELDRWLESVGGPESKAVGPSTKRGLAAWRAGVPVEASGRTGTSNGGAMRIAPIGVLHGLIDPADHDALLNDVVACCLPTHNTTAAISGAAAVAGAIAAGVGGMAWRDVLSAGIDLARLGTGRGAWVYAPAVAERIELGLAIANDEPDDGSFSARIARVIGTGEPTAEAVPAAFAMAHRANGDAGAAIRLAANTPGDTDTIGAMAGAIAGSWSGDGSLPTQWLALVESVNDVSIERWSHQIAQLASAREH